MAKNKQTKNQLWVKVLCIFLAILMLGSALTLIVTMVWDTIEKRHGEETTSALPALKSAPTFNFGYYIR